MPFLPLPFIQAQAPADTAKPVVQDFQAFGQITIIPVHDFNFKSPYGGTHSLLSNNQVATSQTYTAFLGARITKGLELYLNPEDTRGLGLGDGYGLAGAPNTEVIHTSKSVYPYWARAFFRWTIATQKGAGVTQQDAAQNQLAGPIPNRRVVVTAGKMSTADIFDTNRYANSPRTEFMNLDFVNSAAYDYAADIRGYSIGFATEYYGPGYALRVGAFQMPTVANGEQLDGDLAHAQGKQVELETYPKLLKKHDPATLRILGYLNHARMGSYSEALAIANQNHSIPDVAATDAPGRFKYGFNLNLEQPLGDEGETGLFARFATNDGKTESYVYSEAEASFTTGAQISGRRFRAGDDRLGVALGINGLGRDHRAYLEAGGIGFQIGDGRLSYGTEQLVETYYNHRLGKNATLGLDLQAIANPGYNRDRGPVVIAGIRLHFEF